MFSVVACLVFSWLCREEFQGANYVLNEQFKLVVYDIVPTVAYSEVTKAAITMGEIFALVVFVISMLVQGKTFFYVNALTSQTIFSNNY